MKKLLISFGFALALAPSFAFAQLTSGPPWGGNVPAPSAPQNLQYECNMLTGDQVRLWWSPAANATNYSIRVNIPGHTDFVHVIDNHPQTSITLPITPNQEYAWWVHANNAANPLGPYTIGPRFTCHPNPSQAPTFSASPTSGAAPLAVTFKFSGTGNTYRVDFGDDASQDLHPECYTGGGCEFPHTYASVGTYTASLRTVAGASVASVSISVTSPQTSQPSITITAPQSGASVSQGNILPVSWISTNPPGGSFVTLVIDGGCFAQTSWPSTGSANVPISASCPVGLHTLTASLYGPGGGGAALATAQIPFTVTSPGGTAQPSITITSPQPGASVAQGSNLTISWTSQNAPANSKALLQIWNQTGPIFQVGNKNPNDNHVLSVPNTTDWSPGNYKIKVGLVDTAGTFVSIAEIPIVITAAGNPPPFEIGDRVRATDALNVRATPSTSGTILGAQPTGREGTITDGPQNGNGFTWWKIDWDNSPIDGWSVQNFIVKIPNNTPSITITAPPPNQNYSIGSVIPISWTSQNAPAGTSVRLTLASPSSLPWVPGLPVNGSYNFTVPTILPGTYYIIVDLMTPAGAVLAHASVPYTVGGPANQNTLTANPSSGPAPLTTTFAFTVTNTLLAFRINFGDGTPLHEITAAEKSCTGTGPCSGSIAHTYASPGTYTAKLLANGGAETATAVVTATTPGANQPYLTATPSSGQAPLAVSLSARIYNCQSAPHFRFDFGDGTVVPPTTFDYNVDGGATGAVCDFGSAAHSYTSPGTYTARIYHVNNLGYTIAQATVTITAAGNPPPFEIGDRVRATDALNVRATPSTSGTILGAQPTGREGTIIAGPQSANGFTWWKINWDNSPIDGWSVQNYIVKLPQPPVPPNGIGSCVYRGETFPEETVKTILTSNGTATPIPVTMTCDNGAWMNGENQVCGPYNLHPWGSGTVGLADFGCTPWPYGYYPQYRLKVPAPRHGQAPLTVTAKINITLQATGPMCAAYSLNWGDGTTESAAQTSPNVACPDAYKILTRTHTYTTPGSYTIRYTVTPSSDTVSDSVNIRVDGPVAAAQNESQLANSLTALESALQSILKLLGR